MLFLLRNSCKDALSLSFLASFLPVVDVGLARVEM
jgi:hypothetical protein